MKLVISGLRDDFNKKHYEETIEKTGKEVQEIAAGTHVLIIGMVSWLSVITVILVIVFIVVYKKFEVNDDDDAGDAESNIGDDRSDKSSVVDFSIFAVSGNGTVPFKMDRTGYDSTGVEEDASEEDSEEVEEDSTYGSGNNTSDSTHSSVTVSVEEGSDTGDDRQPAVVQASEI